MSRFNLVDEAWIPVRLQDRTRAQLGLKEVFFRSKEIVEIEDPSPLVVGALYRFLLAVLYRALQGPADILQAKKLFSDGLPLSEIDAYLNKWRDRFWLIDETHPFHQVPYYTPIEWRAWTVLAAERNADNAKVLFDHTDVTDAGSIELAWAARLLLATQTFALSSGKSEFVHTSGAPSATAVMVLPLGVNLQDSLIFSLVPQNREILTVDLPVWEQEPPTVESLRSGIQRQSRGLADLYTWRSRTVRFEPTPIEGVTRVAFASGEKFLSLDQVDPMVPYRIIEEKGRLPLEFQDRGLWRDFDSLLPDSGDLAPVVINHAIALSRLNPNRFPRAILVLGQSNSKAKIEFWRQERFTLPRALLTDRFIRTEISQLLEKAEAAQRTLYSAISSFARNVISRGDRKPDKKDISKFIKQTGIINTYWSKLETYFNDVLGLYEDGAESNAIMQRWFESIQIALSYAWHTHQNSLPLSDVWTIRAIVKAEPILKRKLKDLKQDASQLSGGGAAL